MKDLTLPITFLHIVHVYLNRKKIWLLGESRDAGTGSHAASPYTEFGCVYRRYAAFPPLCARGPRCADRSGEGIEITSLHSNHSSSHLSSWADGSFR